MLFLISFIFSIVFLYPSSIISWIREKWKSSRCPHGLRQVAFPENDGLLVFDVSGHTTKRNEQRIEIVTGFCDDSRCAFHQREINGNRINKVCRQRGLYD